MTESLDMHQHVKRYSEKLEDLPLRSAGSSIIFVH